MLSNEISTLRRAEPSSDKNAHQNASKHHDQEHDQVQQAMNEFELLFCILKVNIKRKMLTNTNSKRM